ncbi:MAG: hypothetical protein H6R01_439 [Burkholderiaceae bacterium]|nr:hypothetical protein [Burkholderiaceae bacterium]
MVKNTETKTPKLEAYIAQHESVAQEKGIVVTSITYPKAEEHVFPGVYSGIVITSGTLSATYSDGSKH